MFTKCRCGLEINLHSGGHVAVRQVIRTETDIHGSIVEDTTDAGLHCSRDCAAHALLGHAERDPYAESGIL